MAVLERFEGSKTKKRLKAAFLCASLSGQPSTALFRTLAWVLFAACPAAALQADLLAFACGGGEAVWRDGLGGADVGFDSDFLGHDGLRVEMGKTSYFKPERAAAG
jgi:hypothetical protein